MRPTPLLKLASAALCAAALLPAVAGAAPAVDGVFNLGGAPNHLTLGPDGNVWVALDGVTSDVARIAPDGTVIGSFQTADITDPNGIVVGPDGNLWVTQDGGVVRFSATDPPQTTLFPVPKITDPRGIVVGSDGNLWTASTDQAIRIGTDGTANAFTVADMGARGIAAGGDGRLYIADFLQHRVVALKTDGSISSSVPLDGGAQEVAAGPGNQIVATVPSNLLSRFTPPSTTVQNTTVTGFDPFGIVFAPDGAYWAVAFARDGLTRMTPDGAVTTLPGFPKNSGPRYLTIGTGGTLWVALELSHQVARVTGVVSPTLPPPPPPPGDTTAPGLTNVRLPASLRVGRSGTLRITLSEPATVTIRFERKLLGRRKAGKCVAPRRARHGRRCTHFVAAGTQTRRAVSGANRLAIGGKLGRRTLPAGSYRLTIVATDAAGNAAKPIRRSLTVAKRPSRRQQAPQHR